MDGAQIGGIPLNWQTMVRLALVVVLAIVVRQVVLRLGAKAIGDKRGGNHNGKPRR